MKILLQGIEVRKEELVEIIEVEYDQLNEIGQKRFFKENKDLFFIQALLSKYESVRKLAIILRNDCSSDTINKAIQKLLHVNNIYELPDYDLIFILLNTDNFIISKSNRINLSHSYDKKICECITHLKKSS